MVYSPSTRSAEAHAIVFPNLAVETRRRWGWVLLAGIVVLAVVYLVQVNAVATKGYEISSLQKELDSVRHTASKLEIQAAELQSLKTTQSDLPDKSFVAVQHLEYLSSTTIDTGVAVR